jgi:pteridine reductase
VSWPPRCGVDEKLKAEIIARTQLKRLGSPRDVALAARYFAADAPFVTGQILAIDGGRSLGD